MSDSLLAIVACCAIIAAFLMAAFAYRLNESWANHCKNYADLLDEQNEFVKKLNHEWYNAYMKMVDMKAEAAENGRD